MRIPFRIRMRFQWRFYRDKGGYALTVLFGFVGFTWLYKYPDWMFTGYPDGAYSGFYLLWIPIKLLEGNTMPCRGFRWKAAVSK